MGMRRFRVNVARDSALAEHAFRAMSYIGTDGAIVWKAACWANTGAITEAQFADAFQGVRIVKPAKPVGYFRAILKDALGEARLSDLMRRTSLPRGLIPGPRAMFVERARERRGRDEDGRRLEPPMRMSDVLRELQGAGAAERSP